VTGKRGKPVAIGNLIRFTTDWERSQGLTHAVEKAAPSGKRVAIVGSGPRGWHVPGDLIKAGHEVTVFESLHELGGVLMYGIPEFRLPKSIVREEVAALENWECSFTRIISLAPRRPSTN